MQKWQEKNKLAACVRAINLLMYLNVTILKTNFIFNINFTNFNNSHDAFKLLQLNSILQSDSYLYYSVIKIIYNLKKESQFKNQSHREKSTRVKTLSTWLWKLRCSKHVQKSEKEEFLFLKKAFLKSLRKKKKT